MSNLVELKITLTDGGMFYASWPKTITKKSLHMVVSLFWVTMDAWIYAADRRDAAETEYLSWFPGNIS